ncbi:MAG: hypothetical protein CMJ23_01665 [Phycisphaerae bacterium]|nr:hypothetical protein [Phycisphaerae bacterium]
MPDVIPVFILALTGGLLAPILEPPAEEPNPVCCQPAVGRSAAILATMQEKTPSEVPASVTPAIPADAIPVLDAIEAQSISLREFASRIRMDNYDDLADETERRFGRVWLASSKAGDASDRVAAVVFERTVESGGRVRERVEHFVYRDCILSDYDHEARRLVRRRICEPGDRQDPLRLGEGPIPIPIGQRKADILKAFEVSLAPTPPSALVKDPEGVVGLHLVPRPGTTLAREGKIESIDYWLRVDGTQPMAVEIRESTRDRVGLKFMTPRFNSGLDAEARRWMEAPEVDPESWRIEDK